MSILVLSEVFPPQTGGSGRWLWELHRRLPPEEVVIVAGDHPRAAEFDRTHNLDISRLPLAWGTWGVAGRNGFRGYCRAFRVIWQLVKSRRVTQIRCGCILPEGWLAWMLRTIGGPRYVCFVHGEELNIVQSSRELRWMTRRVLSGAELVVANSSNTARLLGDQWSVRQERLRLLHPGVDASLFVPAERNDAMRRQLGWAGRTVVLTVGRLQKRKGHDMLIRALPRIAKTIPDVLYAIVGNGEERQRLEKIAVQCNVSDRVQFLGELGDEQLIYCYQQCDLFVLPNRNVDGDFEGFGMVLVEAQACGKPVVAGASGGTIETMRCGETGCIVDCTDAKPLAEAVTELLSEPGRLKQMGCAAREWVVTAFDWPAQSLRAEEMLLTRNLRQSNGSPKC